MPPTSEHARLSLRRTGKNYREIHEWIDEEHTRGEKLKHDIINIPRFLPVVEKKFGKEGVQEYLYHIKEDYEETRAYKLAKFLMKLKFW